MSGLDANVQNCWRTINGIPAMATHPRAPNPTHLLSCPENTPVCTQRLPLVWRRHTLPSAQRRSLLINTAGLLPSHHSFKHTTRCSGAQGVHPKTCPVHMLTRSFGRNVQTAPRCPTTTWRLWPLDQGKGYSCLEGGLLGAVAQGATGSSRPFSDPVGQGSFSVLARMAELHRVAGCLYSMPIPPPQDRPRGTSLHQAQPDPD